MLSRQRDHVFRTKYCWLLHCVDVSTQFRHEVFTFFTFFLSQMLYYVLALSLSRSKTNIACPAVTISNSFNRWDLKATFFVISMALQSLAIIRKKCLPNCGIFLNVFKSSTGNKHADVGSGGAQVTANRRPILCFICVKLMMTRKW